MKLNVPWIVMIASLALALHAQEPETQATPAAPTRPNVVLFVVDDLGWQDLSLALHAERTASNDRYRTPNVERLAAAGMRFTDAYSAGPVCTPSRAALMTGVSPAALRITNWILDASGVDAAPLHARLGAPAWNVRGLQPGATTLASLLRDVGYRTIHVGKWHVGAVGTPGSDPTKMGFEVAFASHGAGAPGSHYGKDDFAGRYGNGESIWDVKGLDAWHGKDVFLDDVLAERAVAEIDASLAANKPFFLNFWTYGVHSPLQPNPRLVAKYEGLDERELAYATMIETVDQALGAVLDALEKHAIAQDTLVVFTSDNGGLSAISRKDRKHAHNAPLRGGKATAYEGGLRVPLVVRWPRQTRKPGTSSAQPVIGHDLFVTIARAAGAKIPQEHAKRVEGVVDLRDLLLIHEIGYVHDLFWNAPHPWASDIPDVYPFTAMRSRQWKLIFNHDTRAFELYDLVKDLGERKNLAAEEPEVVAELAKRMRAWIERTGAQLSIVRESGEAIALPR